MCEGVRVSNSNASSRTADSTCNEQLFLSLEDIDRKLPSCPSTRRCECDPR